MDSEREVFLPNRWEVLKQWLEEDLNVVRTNVGEEEEEKNILRVCSEELLILSEKSPRYKSTALEIIKKMKNESFKFSMNMVSEFVTRLFVENCFTSDIYDRKVREIQQSRSWKEQLVEGRIKFGSALPALDFFVAFTRREEWMELPIPLKAALISRSSLKLYEDFKKGVGEFGPSGKLGKYKMKQFLFSSCITSENFPNSLRTNESSSHISVLTQGKLFKVNVIHKNGEMVNMSSLYHTFCSILKYEVTSENETFFSGYIGALTFADRKDCHEARKDLIRNEPENSKFFETLDNSVFVLCLDIFDRNPSSTHTTPTTTNPSIEEINHVIHQFTSRCHNRWFGQTQLIISGQHGDFFGYYSFLKGVEGHFTIIFSKVLQETMLRTLEKHNNNNNTQPITQFEEVKLLQIKGGNDVPNSVKKLMDPGLHKQFFHLQKSMFRVPFGYRFFKERNLSPNTSFNILMGRAMCDIVKNEHMKNMSYAVGLMNKNLSRHVYWENFNMCICKEMNCVDDVKYRKMFKDAEEYEVRRMKLCKSGCSPTFLVDRASDEAVNHFIFNLAKKVNYFHGMRFYVFTINHGFVKTDVRTSSMPFGDALMTLGRPGCYLSMYSYFGVHYCMNENYTDMMFMPEANFASRLGEVVERLKFWAYLLK